MSLLNIDEMTNELNRRMGVQGELLVNQVGSILTGDEYNVIVRALNDAFLQTVLRYRHTEFEADKPYFFDNLSTAPVDGVVIADTNYIISSGAGIGLEPDGVTRLSSLERWVDGVLEVGGMRYTITDVIDNNGDRSPVGAFVPPYKISVAPQFGVALTASTFTMGARRYPLPVVDGNGTVVGPNASPPASEKKLIFFIYNLTDITNNVPLSASDVRLYDRSVPILGQPNYYDRLKNDLFIHPAPYICSTTGGAAKVTFRMRYAYRPTEKTGTDTLAPLPEEWQEVVMLEAYGKLLDMENEHERATATRAASAELAAQIMVPFYEEMDDAEPAFKPVLRRW
ncbi:MAG TPA: hypothetical protein VNA25_29415 [Phycisphaerae bacterium]|nr:hypothetical protein [Phycisphaerae bacterium]